MKKFLVIITIILIGFVIPMRLNAEALGDPNDIFEVNYPTPNQKVKGIINVSWRMYDNNQNNIQYNAWLFDYASCKDVNYGSINSATSGISSATQDNVIQWNTNGTLANSTLADGNYCLKICVALYNNSTSYSACNSRVVLIVNHNRLPVINSTPSNLTIHESDSWQYQINASDADGDKLTYRLVAGTNFLTINQQTGLVSTNSASKKLAAGVVRADYNIVVAADDGISGSATQQFTLTIIKDVEAPVINPPNPNNNPTPNPVPVETVNSPSVVNISYPKEDSVLKGVDNKLSWDVADAEGVKSVSLKYSIDGNTWIDITKIDDPTNSKEKKNYEYNWDVSKITDGKYYLQIVVIDVKDAETTMTSKQFQIQNDQGQQIESSPLIINVKPENNSEISDNKPSITGDFVPSEEKTIDTTTFKILVDNKDVTDKCDVAISSFHCITSQPLEDGRHSVVATIKDSSGQEAKYEWVFNVNTNVAAIANNNVITILGREVPKNTLILITLICCLLAVLLFIPWVLYLLWSRRNGNHDSEEVTTSSESYTQAAEPQYQAAEQYVYPTPSDVSTNYYVPEQYTTPAQPLVDTTSQPVVSYQPEGTYQPQPEAAGQPDASNLAPIPTETNLEPTQNRTETTTTTTYEPVEPVNVAELSQPVIPPAPEAPVQPPIESYQTQTDQYNSVYNPTDLYPQSQAVIPTTPTTPENPAPSNLVQTGVPEVPPAPTTPQSTNAGFVEPVNTDK